MNYDAMPQIRLEVEHMKHSILHHLGVAGSQLGECLEKEIQAAIETYPWQHRVTEIVHHAIDDYVKAYWSYGKGSKRITQAIDDAFSQRLDDDQQKP